MWGRSRNSRKRERRGSDVARCVSVGIKCGGGGSIEVKWGGGGSVEVGCGGGGGVKVRCDNGNGVRVSCVGDDGVWVRRCGNGGGVGVECSSEDRDAGTSPVRYLIVYVGREGEVEVGEEVQGGSVHPARGEEGDEGIDIDGGGSEGGDGGDSRVGVREVIVPGMSRMV